MDYLCAQIGGVLLAVTILPLALYWPGKFFLNSFPSLRSFFAARFGASLLLSMATMPMVLYYIARIFGLRGDLYFCLIFPVALAATGGKSSLFPRRRSGDWLSWVLAGGWLLAVIFFSISIPIGHKLYATTMSFDWAKHIMVTDALARTGVPPINPAIHPGYNLPLCYYYLWHLIGAVFVCGILTPQAVTLGGVFWAGIGVVSIFHQFLTLLYPEVGKPQQHPLRGLALVLLLLVGSMASVLVLLRIAIYLSYGKPLEIYFLSVLSTGSEPVFSWMNTSLTSPHHMASFVIAMTGFLMLRMASAAPGKMSWVAAALAGIAFASMAGMSIWVGSTAAVIGAAWFAVLLLRCEKNEIGLWIMSGVVAAVLIAPFAFELRHANQLTGSPIGFRVRGFTFTHLMQPPLKTWVDLLCLPLNYTIEIGFPLIASFLIWRLWSQNVALTRHQFFIRVMFWASIIYVSFVASVVRHNDLGWRGTLFAQAACVMWAWPLFASMFSRLSGISGTWPGAAARRCPRLWKVTIFALWAGWLSAIMDPLMLRFTNRLLDVSWIVSDAPYSSITMPDDKHTAERLAAYYDGYEWMRTQTPKNTLVAMNPDHEDEVPFFLYANRPAIVCDLYNATIFGVSRETYRSVAKPLAPIFAAQPATWNEVLRILVPLGTNYLVLRSNDAAWGQPSDWPAPVYHNEKLAIYRLN